MKKSYSILSTAVLKLIRRFVNNVFSALLNFNEKNITSKSITLLLEHFGRDLRRMLGIRSTGA